MRIKAPMTNPGSTSTAPVPLDDGQNRTRATRPRPSSISRVLAFNPAFVVKSPVMLRLRASLKIVRGQPRRPAATAMTPAAN